MVGEDQQLAAFFARAVSMAPRMYTVLFSGYGTFSLVSQMGDASRADSAKRRTGLSWRARHRHHAGTVACWLRDACIHPSVHACMPCTNSWAVAPHSARRGALLDNKWVLRRTNFFNIANEAGKDGNRFFC